LSSAATNIDFPDQNICDGNNFELKQTNQYKHSLEKINQTITGENQETLIVKKQGLIK
jgi:hypothetical protein